VLHGLLRSKPGVMIWYHGRWHVGGANLNNPWNRSAARTGFTGGFRAARGLRRAGGIGGSGRLPGSFETGKRR
jgi:hypothetical protein